MTTHTATIAWLRNDAKFVDRRYSRVHRWSFDGGAQVAASSSPHVVRAPFSDPACVDPEEAYVAALASCHMLWFLDLASRAGYVVDRYDDEARGDMESVGGIERVARVTLLPTVVFSGANAPDDAMVKHLHHEAHRHCYLANSVHTEIVEAGTWRHMG